MQGRSHRSQQQRRAGGPVERLLVGEHELEVQLREPRMLARDALGPSAVPRADRLDQQPVLVLCDEQRLAGAGQPLV